MEIVCAAVASILLVGLIFVVLQRKLRGAGKRAERELRQTYGERLRLITGCGVISGPNRVPGLLGLLEDRLVYRALVIRERGEIPLAEVEAWRIIPARESEHRRVHKYLHAHVVELSGGGETRLFVIAAADAERWRAALEAVARGSARG